VRTERAHVDIDVCILRARLGAGVRAEAP
jgi:hypothetical protein